MKKQLFIFFGKTGVGKDFVASIFAKELGFIIYNADLDLPQEMISSIKKKKEFTDNMRNNFLHIIKLRIKELLKTYDKIILTQGLFKNKHRKELAKEFSFAKFFWIDAENSIINNRIISRNSIVNIDYANKINNLFETPNFTCIKIINNLGESEILAEINKLKGFHELD